MHMVVLCITLIFSCILFACRSWAWRW